MYGLSGKTFAVVGAANGIGRATAETLARAGSHLALFDRDELRLRATTEKLLLLGVQCSVTVGDLNREVDLERFGRDVRERHGSLHGVANIAAEVHFETLTNSLEPWERVIRGSAGAYSIIVRHLLPMLKESKGSIVNMSSISAHAAQQSFGTYAASKAAVTALTRCMAADLAPYGIRANSIAPGTVWTEANAGHIFRNVGMDRKSADSSSDIGGRHLLRRCAEPEEVALPIAFLLSEAASFITGSELLVDGGYLAT